MEGLQEAGVCHLIGQASLFFICDVIGVAGKRKALFSILYNIILQDSLKKQWSITLPQSVFSIFSIILMLNNELLRIRGQLKIRHREGKEDGKVWK